MRGDQTRLRQGRCELEDGRRVKYLLKKRAGDPFYLVRFIGPSGKQKELSTKERDVRRAHHAAVRRIYLEFGNYEPAAPVEIPAIGKRSLGWNDATTLLVLNMRMSGLQSSTIESYIGTIRLLRKVFPGTHGPDEITAEMAEIFRERRLAAGASQATVASNLMTLSSVYARWWRTACGMLEDDPFEGVKVDSNGADAL